MGILSVVNRDLLSNSKSQLLKYLSSSSNSQFIRRIYSPAAHDTGLNKAPPTIVGEFKSNNNNSKLTMLLIEHFHGNHKSFYWDPSPPPYNYSLISADNSWNDHRSLCNPFPGLDNCHFAGSCNELMLLLFLDRMILWNPTTMEIVKTLPKSDVPAPLPIPATKTTIARALGFDPESEDYKVLRFIVYDYENGMHSSCYIPNIEVYSLKTNSWKEITHDCYRGPRLLNPSVQVNGVYYWGGFPSPPPTIISFNFADEKFSSVILPPKFDEHKKVHNKEKFHFECGFVLVEFDGSLAALVHSQLSESTSENPFSFEVWGWNGESWLERMSRVTIDVPGGVVKVLGLFQDDKLYLQNGVGELMLFHLAKRRLESLDIHANPRYMSIFPYVGSSVLFQKMGNK